MSSQHPRVQETARGSGMLAGGFGEIAAETRGFLRRNRAEGYVVGGFLRDQLLGTASKDLDLVVTKIEPSDLAFHLHSRLGFSRPAVFPRFETALTVGRGIEIEICRMEPTMEEDAARRDFTMNCLYADLGGLFSSGWLSGVLDPTGRGLTDLRQGVLRTPVDPCTTLWLDPLRMLRALRLAATRGFRLDRTLENSIPRVVYLVDRVAGERIKTELERILLSGRVVSAFRRMQALGVCDVVLPEVSATYGFEQATPYHAYDLFTHTLKTVANAKPDPALRWAALLHDVGKPYSRTMKRGRAVYYGHQDVSTEMAESVMRRLRFSRRLREQVTFLVRHHMIHYSQEWSDRAVRRFVRKMGSHLDMMLHLAEADQRAQVPGAGPDIPARGLKKRIAALREADGIHFDLPVTGREIMSLMGIGEGPLVGRAKERLLKEASKRSKPMNRREAVALLRRWAKSQGLL